MGRGLRDATRFCDALYACAFEARRCPDIVLRAFGTAYPAHRIILASQSTYFSALLRWVSWEHASHRQAAGEEGGADWSDLPSHELTLGEDVTQLGFEWILEYFYASPRLAIASDNVFDVLAAAHYLGIPAVQTACVEFLSQHLDPSNLCACLDWATRADHGEASDMLAAACRRVLALRLPRALPAWAPALLHVQPATLLDILASDHLAVPTEYDRYLLVQQVAALLSDAAAAAAAAAAQERPAAGLPPPAGSRGSRARNSGGLPASAVAVAAAVDGDGAAELQRLLRSALHVSDERLARHLRLARSCPAAIPCPRPPSAAAAGGAGGGGDADDAELVAGSPGAFSVGSLPPSDCAEGGGTMTAPSSQASSRSLARSSCNSAAAAGSGAAAAAEGAACAGGRDSRAGSCAGEDDGGVASSRLLRLASGRGPAAEAPTSAAEAAAPTPAPVGVPSVADRRAAAAGPEREPEPEPLELQPLEPDPLGLEACASLLLHEAVRFEHLTVPQLMAVEREGRVAAHVLHRALWERTRLDYLLSARPAVPPREVMGAEAAAGPQQREPAPAAAAAVGYGRAFRFSWRLPCGVLKKLQPHETLQSEAHQYAGADWRLRLCCSGSGSAGQRAGAGAEAGGAIGLYVGRLLQPAAGTTHGSFHDPPGFLQRPAGPQPQHRPLHRRPGQPRQQQQQHAQLPAPPLPQPPPPQPPHELQQSAFCSFADRLPALRSRCRVSAWQSDNTAMQGRLCLGDSGDFTADFVAGGYYGAGRLLRRSDLACLPDDADVLLFVSVHALLGAAEPKSGA